MGDNADRRRAALRKLFEQWNVPLAQLVDVSGMTLKSLKSVAKRDQWTGGNSTASLRVKMIDIFDKSLSRFSQVGVEQVDEEKLSRTFAVLVKTLESIAVVGSKIAAEQEIANAALEKEKSDKQTDKKATDLDPARTADLDRQLAQLVQNLT